MFCFFLFLHSVFVCSYKQNVNAFMRTQLTLNISHGTWRQHPFQSLDFSLGVSTSPSLKIPLSAEMWTHWRMFAALCIQDREGGGILINTAEGRMTVKEIKGHSTS